MDTKLVVAVILIVVLAASTGYFAYAYSSTNSKLSAQQATLSQVQSTLSSVQPQVALALAMSHWNNIAIENVSAIMEEYAPNATLRWVGGPLTGTYTGTSQISSTWTKFTNLYEAVFWYAITPPTVTKNGNGFTVVAPLQFVVTPTSDPIHTYILNVTETLDYQPVNGEYMLVNEIWAVKPLDLSVALPGYPTSQALQTQMVLAQAYAHWNAIGIENATLITSEYTQNALLMWEGGPLSGNYTGLQAINQTWTRFSNLYVYVVWYAIMPPTVTLSGNTAKVVGYLQFVVFPFATSSNPHPHSYVLNVTDTLWYQYVPASASWMLYQEIWAVHPIPISDVAPGYTPSYYNTTAM
jgi:type II secretory pathway pseudopilin PulG